MTTLAGDDINAGFQDGIGTAARFNRPWGIVSDGEFLYVADQTNHAIRKIDIATGSVTTLAGSGTAGTVDGPGQSARFDNPVSITLVDGYLYVGTLAHAIRRIEIATGMVTTLAGSPGNSGAIDGVGRLARFKYPMALTADNENIYVGEDGLIRKIEIATAQVSTLAGQAGVYDTQDGTGSEATFYQIFGLTVNAGHLYVTEGSHRVIRKIRISTGEVTTFVGFYQTGTFELQADGPADEARFIYPHGITSDGVYLYVADSGTIRRIRISTGETTSLLGTAILINFLGPETELHNPYTLTTDGRRLYYRPLWRGHLSIMHEIRRID